MHPRLLIAAVALLAVLVPAPAAMGYAIAPGARTTPTPVVLIVMENHSYGQVVGSNEAHYLNRRFIPAGRLFRNYRAIGHPSLPNYLAMTSGTTSGCRTDSCPTGRYRTDNVFHQLALDGENWQAFEQSMPSSCDRTSSGRYLVRHNPPPYYRDLRHRPCRLEDVAYPSSLPSPLSDFTFVTPNACSDMHDCSVRTGDRWLRSHVPSFLHAGAIVVIVFDEGSSTNRVMAAEVGPGVTAGSSTRRSFTHYGLLAGIETHFGLRLLHAARHAHVLPI